MSLAVATDGNSATATAIRDLIRAMDADLAVPTVQSMERLVDTSVDARRFQMMLVLILGLVALTLAGVGVYAVLSQAIAQRVPEIGLRMAIGATPDVIQSMVLRRALWPVIGGFTAGALGSSLLRPFIEGSLFRVGFVDATTYAAVLAFVVSVALVASYLPARRAASLDPLVALRAE
jgi:ABC-type antimicrobial peptide transport system permease subunit